jgi:hypothetical protein
MTHLSSLKEKKKHCGRVTSCSVQGTFSMRDRENENSFAYDAKAYVYGSSHISLLTVSY